MATGALYRVTAGSDKMIKGKTLETPFPNCVVFASKEDGNRAGRPTPRSTVPGGSSAAGGRITSPAPCCMVDEVAIILSHSTDGWKGVSTVVTITRQASTRRVGSGSERETTGRLSIKKGVSVGKLSGPLLALNFGF